MADSSAPKPKHEETRPRLGRGLAALIGDSGNETDAIVRTRGQKRVPIEFLKPSPLNPRRMFPEEELAELAASIREKGVIQPILVRTRPGVSDQYEIVAGERRWRAAALAEQHEVPIFTIEADDKQALEIAIIENVQRSNLNIIEEAEGYARLSEEFGYTQGDLAKVIGKSRPHVNNTMRLLKLPSDTRYLITSGQISAGHARVLLNADDPHDLAQRVVQRGLSVRTLEDIVRRESEVREAEGGAKARTRYEKDADTLALEQRLGHRTGLFVDVKHSGEGGEVRIKYQTLEQLDHLIRLLGA